METKLSKVLSVIPAGSFESQYGMMYQFIITFENLDSGTFTTKVENQDRFQVGKEVNYTIELKSGKKGNYYVVKAATTDGAKKEWKYQYEAFALAVQNSNPSASMQSIVERAKEFEYYLNTGKIKGEQPQQFKQIQEETLPF